MASTARRDRFSPTTPSWVARGLRLTGNVVASINVTNLERAVDNAVDSKSLPEAVVVISITVPIGRPFVEELAQFGAAWRDSTSVKLSVTVRPGEGESAGVHVR